MNNLFPKQPLNPQVQPQPRTHKQLRWNICTLLSLYTCYCLIKTTHYIVLYLYVLYILSLILNYSKQLPEEEEEQQAVNDLVENKKRKDQFADELNQWIVWKRAMYAAVVCWGCSCVGWLALRVYWEILFLYTIILIWCTYRKHKKQLRRLFIKPRMYKI